MIEPRIILNRMKRTAMLLAALILAFPLFAQHRRAVLPSAPPCGDAELAAPYLTSDLAADAQYVYFSSDDNGLYRLTKTGGGAPELLTFAADQIIAIAVDSQKLYFITAPIDGFLASIYSVSKSGGTPAVLTTSVVAPSDLVVDDTYLYWNSTGTPSNDGEDVAADGKIEKMRKDGTGRVTLVDSLSFPLSIALDGDNVLFAETGLAIGDPSAGLRSVPKAGGAVTTLVDNAPVIGIAPGPSAIYFGSLSSTTFAATINAIDRNTKTVTELANAPGAIPLIVRLAGDQVYYYLLSDEDSRVAKELGAYRAWLPGGLHTRRMTYVIDTDRRLVDSFGSEMQFDDHADRALAILASLRDAV